MLPPPLRERVLPERPPLPLLLRDEVDFAAPDERLEPVPVDFARDELDLAPPLLTFVPLLADRELLLCDLDAPLEDLAPLLPEPLDFEARDEVPERFAPEDEEELRPLVDLPEL